MGEARGREDGGVVADDEVVEETPELRIGGGDVDVATPDPSVPPFFLIRAIGCGSWMKTMSPRISIVSMFRRLVSMKISKSVWVISTPFPWSELWNFFVTSKNWFPP